MFQATPPLPIVQRSSYPLILLQFMDAGHNAGSPQRRALPNVPEELGNGRPSRTIGAYCAGAVDQMSADHVAAGFRLHRLIDAGTLIGAPVLSARDEAGRHVNGSAGPGLQFRGEGTRGAAAIPLQTALESGAAVFAAVERKLAVGQPFIGGDRRRIRHFLRDRRGHVLGKIHHIIGRQFCQFAGRP
jgi:hypothetical protein